MRSRECDEEVSNAKQEGDHHHEEEVNINQMMLQEQSSRQWSSGFRNPRIVRVSRTFGGKDRHSKVCTVRGLRDRRIRLSVPTAIQLYDLQDRLGLSQPSKVIDWLLQAAKDDVDELPPLQFPPGFNQIYPNLFFGESSSTTTFPPAGAGSNLGFLESWDLGASSSRTRSSRSINNTTQRESFDLDKGKWIRHDDENNNNNNQAHGSLDTNHQHFSLTNPYNNNNNSTSSYYNLGHLHHQSSLDHSCNNVTVAISNVPNNLNLPPSSSSAGDGSQLFFGPPPPAMTSLFPTYPSFLGASHHHHHPHIVDGAGHHHLHLFSSSSQQQQMTMTAGNTSLIRPFHHLMTSTHHHSSDNDSDS